MAWKSAVLLTMAGPSVGLFLAQATDSISGGAGWVGAGLLGLVLGWLMLKHLPDKDKQISGLIDQFGKMLDAREVALRELIAAKDKQISEMLVNKWQIIQSLTKDYRDGIKDVAGHCEQEIARLTTYWQSQMSSLTAAIQDLSEHVQQRLEGK